MPTPLYDVMLTGEILEGRDPQAVIAALARLFSRDAQHIAALMNRGEQVIKRGVDAPTGDRYIEALANAGALGRLTPASPANADAATGGGAQPTSGDAAEPKVRVIAPHPRPADVAFSPIQANRISRAAQGIDVNRVDTSPIVFEDIVLVAAYEDQEAEKIDILIFRRGQKRPYQCDANRIVFTDFSGTKATSVIASLRLFIRLVAQHNPALHMDPPTANFLAGRPPAVLEIDPAKYTTILGTTILSMLADEPTT